MPDRIEPDPSDDESNKCWFCGYHIVNGKPCNIDDQAEKCNSK